MADYSELMKLEKKPVAPKVPTEPTPTKDVVNKSTKQQVTTSVSQHTSKTLKRFGSYLTFESLKELKRIAFESDKKDYEVLQEAVDEYLKHKKVHV